MTLRASEALRGLAAELERLAEEKVTIDLRDIGADAIEWFKANVERAGISSNRDASRSSRNGVHYVDSAHYEVQNPHGRSSEFKLVLWSDHPAANILEKGSGPHVIAPRDGQYLAWPIDNVSAYNPSDKTNFIKRGSVNHPGTPAYHCIEDAVASAAAIWQGARTRPGVPSRKTSKRRAPTRSTGGRLARS